MISNVNHNKMFESLNCLVYDIFAFSTNFCPQFEKVTCLVTLLNRKFQVSKKSLKWTIFGILSDRKLQGFKNLIVSQMYSKLVWTPCTKYFKKECRNIKKYDYDMKEKWEPIFEGILAHLCAQCSEPKFPSCISKIFKKYLNSQYLHYYAHSVF